MLEWVTEYEAGVSAAEIARKYNTNRNKVARFLKKNGVGIRTLSQALTFGIPTDQILSDFDSGMSARSLVKKYIQHYSSITAMTDMLKRHGKIIKQPQTKCDWSFVYNDRSLFMYWLGWVLSDGWIQYKRYQNRDRGIQIGITVQLSDAHILEFFRSEINPHAKIMTINNAKSLRLSIPRKDAEFLEGYGLCPSKSLVLSPTVNLWKLDEHDFHQMLVGFIEGDGSIHNRISSGMPNITIGSGSLDWLEYINTKLVEFGYDHTNIHEFRPNPSKLIPNPANIHLHYRMCSSGTKNMSMFRARMLGCQHALLARKWDRFAKLDDIMSDPHFVIN